MVAYQMDQCANWRDFADACNAQGRAEVRRLPKRLMHAEDPDVLGHALSSGRTLLTVDRTIHYDHAAHITDRHPGILIIANTCPIATMTMRTAIRILKNFKAVFPEWHETSLRNSVVEITSESAQVWSVRDGTLSTIAFLEFDQAGWRERLANVLRENSARSAESPVE